MRTSDLAAVNDEAVENDSLGAAIERAMAKKKEGSLRMSAKEIRKAADVYSEAILDLEDLKYEEEEGKENLHSRRNDVFKILVTLYSNRAICMLKLEDHHQAIKDSNNGLNLIENIIENESDEAGENQESMACDFHKIKLKLMYRRAKALFYTGEYFQAHDDFLFLKSSSQFSTLPSQFKSDVEIFLKKTYNRVFLKATSSSSDFISSKKCDQHDQVDTAEYKSITSFDSPNIPTKRKSMDMGSFILDTSSDVVCKISMQKPLKVFLLSAENVSSLYKDNYEQKNELNNAHLWCPEHLKKNSVSHSDLTYCFDPFSVEVKLKEGLVWGKDYELIEENLWFAKNLSSKFPDSKHIFSRYLYRTEKGNLELEEIPMKIIVIPNEKTFPRVTLFISKFDSFASILKKLSIIWNRSLTEIRLRIIINSFSKFLASSTKIIEVFCDNSQTHELFSEFQNGDGTWNSSLSSTYAYFIHYSRRRLSSASSECFACGYNSSSGVKLFRCIICRSVVYCSIECQKSHWPFHRQVCSSSLQHSTESSTSTVVSEELSINGQVGLRNIGNSCYMNASLQCIFHIPELKSFFLSDRYMCDLNHTNPLGCQGKLASSFATLCKEIWFSRSRIIDPFSFKNALGEFNSQFQGSDQHDAQEFLAFLLDGLHEDLNRILKKPYAPNSDDVNRSLHEAALESWQNHLKRNQSIIVDYFQGQFKSSLECCSCGHKSITFDPFMYVSLPLPEETHRSLSIITMRQDGSPAKKFDLLLPKNGLISDLMQSIQDKFSIPLEKQYVVEIFSGSIYKEYQSGDKLSLIRENEDIVVYEVSSEATEHCNASVKLSISISNGSSSYHSKVLPILIQVSSKITGCELYDIVFKRVKNLLSFKEPRFSELKISEPTQVDNEEVSDKDISELASLFNEYGKICAPISESILNNSPASQFSPSEYPFELRKHGQTRTFYSADKNDLEILYPSDELLHFESNNLVLFVSENYILNVEKITIPETGHLSTKEDSGILKLEDCFRLFTKSEKLEGSESWYCSKCKDHVNAKKQLQLWRLPEILVLHLKRFDSNSSADSGHYGSMFMNFGSSGSKINSFVDFPIDSLRMDDFICPESRPEFVDSFDQLPDYELFGIINHFGQAHFGHYTAYSRTDVVGNEWSHFDDETVTRISSPETEIKTKAAYVLFYRRKVLH